MNAVIRGATLNRETGQVNLDIELQPADPAESDVLQKLATDSYLVSGKIKRSPAMMLLQVNASKVKKSVEKPKKHDGDISSTPSPSK